MATQKLEAEEQESLFHSSPCPLYFVESPSATSHAAQSSNESAILSSPFPSSRGSNNSSFLHDKKTSYTLGLDDGRPKRSNGRQRLRIIGINEEEEGEGDDRIRRRRGLWRFVSLDPSSPVICIGFQVAWRFAASLGVALLVFFLATKPPPPRVAFKMVGFEKFSLNEGLDTTGVSTKILSCHSSMDMEIDNDSKVFGLHVGTPTIQMAFRRLNFGTSQGKGEAPYVTSSSSLKFRLSVGAKDIPVYGAGRSMQDLLESGQGLPLMIKLRSRSSYHVVWNLIKLRYRHKGYCLLFLDAGYDDRRHSQNFNSSCSTTTSLA